MHNISWASVLFQLELIHRELNVAFLTEVELALKMRGKRWPAASLEDEGGGKKWLCSKFPGCRRTFFFAKRKKKLHYQNLRQLTTRDKPLVSLKKHESLLAVFFKKSANKRRCNAVFYVNYAENWNQPNVVTEQLWFTESSTFAHEMICLLIDALNAQYIKTKIL